MPNLTQNQKNSNIVIFDESLEDIVRIMVEQHNVLNANSLEFYEGDHITIALSNNSNYYLHIKFYSSRSTENNRSGSVIIKSNRPNSRLFNEYFFSTYGQLRLAIENSILEIPERQGRQVQLDQIGGIHKDNGFEMRGGDLNKYLKYKKKYLNLKYGIL